MKILLLTPIFPPQKGGGAEDFYKIAKIIKSIGINKITIISSLMRKRMERYKGILVKRIIKMGNSVVEASVETSERIKEEIKRGKYNIIITHSNIISNRRLYNNIFENFKGKLFLFKSDLVPIYDYSIFDQIISISEGIYNFLIKDGAKKEQIVKLPILFKQPTIPKIYKKPIKDKYLFSPGGTNQLKGAYELFKAFGLLKNDIPFPLKLVVAGGGTKYADFNKDIMFLGAISKKKMIEWAYGSEIIVLPSYTEGLPRTILEAISLKKPILFTKGLVPEFDFLEERFLLDKIEPYEIKRKIKNLLYHKNSVRYKPIYEIISSKNPEKEWKNYFLIAFKAPSTLKIKTDSGIERISEKFWGREKKDLLLDILRTFKEKEIDLPVDFILKMVNNLDFPDSEVFLRIGDIYYSLNMKNYAKLFYIKALKFYPQDMAFLSFTRLIFNFKLSENEKKEIKDFILKIKENYSKDRLFDFIVEHSIDFTDNKLATFFRIDENFVMNKLKKYESIKDIRKIRNFININLNTNFPLSYALVKKGLNIFEKMKGKTLEDYFKMAILYKKILKDYNKAYLLFERSIKDNHDSNLLSHIYFHLGELSKALNKKNWKSYYKKGIEILKKKKEKLPIDLYRIGSFYKQLKDFKNATAWFKKLIKNTNDPNLLSSAYFHLGEISKTLNKKSWKSYYKKGFSILEQKKEKLPIDLYRIGSSYKQLKDFKSATFWFKKLIKNSDNPNLLSGAYFHLGEISKTLNKKSWKSYYKKGIEILKNKKEKLPIDLYRIGSSYKQLKDFKSATFWFKKLTQKSDDTNLLPGVYFHLGEIELELGNKNRAIAYFKKCLGFNPEHKKAKEFLKNIEVKNA